jgi:hypothetical protein
LGYLLFFIYLGLFCWLLNKIKFIKKAGIGERTIIILFLVRIVAGITNGYINLYYYPATDIEFFHHEGINQYHLLLSDPGEYFTNLFKYQQQNAGLFDISDSFWNTLRSNLMIKLLSVFNVFSGGRFFINVLFYNFLVFFGSVAFYKIFIRVFPDKKSILIIALFFLPSLIYFSSGTHKDGLIFLGLGIGCYNLYLIFKDGLTAKRLLLAVAGLAIIFLIRNFVLITLLPALVAWIIAERRKKFTLQTFIIIYLFFIVIFFSLGRLHPSLDLPQYVSTRQIAFVEIAQSGKSAININPLFPHFRSFMNNSPQALNHALMRPYLTEKFTLLYIPVAVEIFIYEILFLLFLLFRAKNKKTEPFVYFGIFFSLSMFLMIGYTIPIIGAIVRYRSIFFPLLIIPIICYTDWDKVKSFFHFKK